MTVQEFATRAGPRYELTRGPGDGIVVTVLMESHHSEEQLEAAKREIRKARDVILLLVRREAV